MSPEQVANELLKIAAKRSVRSMFGWTDPDCVVLQEAARILKGKPEPKPDDGRAPGVLSETLK